MKVNELLRKWPSTTMVKRTTLHMGTEETSPKLHLFIHFLSFWVRDCFLLAELGHLLTNL